MPFKEETIRKLLLEKGLITQAQINEAMENAKKTGSSMETALEKLGYITENDIVNILAGSMGVPYINLEDYLIDTEVASLVPEQLVKKYNVMPLFKIGDTLTIAMVNPKDIMALDDIRVKTKINIIEPALATEKQIQKKIDEYYGTSSNVDEIVKTIDSGKLPASASEESDARLLAKEAEQAPVVKLVNMIISHAVKERASDVHIEPEESEVRIRYRIDGVLHEGMAFPKHLESVILSRIKILSKMDIAESRRPQDGRMQLKMDNKRLDVRVSSFPTVHGENIVMRILDKTSMLIGLRDLGLREAEFKEFDKLIHRPYGIILVTGPTGSGKTTTLYAALSSINSPEVNIITIEDPVEYEIPFIRQTQVNTKAGVTFAAGLRAILRQDPDIIMVGEIRDKDTADIAIQASLTGHLVFSTLHTNDAPGAIARLADMGIEPFLISTSVIGVLAQRLVRAICAKCKKPYKADAGLSKELGIRESLTLYRGEGCEQCKNTGYTGRIGIFEFMPLSEDIKKLIVTKSSSDKIRQAASGLGVRSLREDGMEKAKLGVTSIEEVMRVTAEV